MQINRWRPSEMPDLTWFDYDPPGKDVCICDQCGTVLRPAAGIVGDSPIYRCCGQFWGYHARYHKPLPIGFWRRFRYGDQVPKRYRPEDEVNDEPEIDEEENAA